MLSMAAARPIHARSWSRSAQAVMRTRRSGGHRSQYFLSVGLVGAVGHGREHACRRPVRAGSRSPRSAPAARRLRTPRRSHVSRNCWGNWKRRAMEMVMAVDGEAMTLPSAAPLRAGDGRRMIGQAAAVRGLDRDGIDAVAIWHVATDGLRTGAWVVPSEKAFGDAATAEWMLAVLAQRAILAWDNAAIAHVEQIEAAARSRWPDTNQVRAAHPTCRIGTLLSASSEMAANSSAWRISAASRSGCSARIWSIDMPRATM